VASVVPAGIRLVAVAVDRQRRDRGVVEERRGRRPGDLRVDDDCVAIRVEGQPIGGLADDGHVDPAAADDAALDDCLDVVRAERHASEPQGRRERAVAIGFALACDGRWFLDADRVSQTTRIDRGRRNVVVAAARYPQTSISRSCGR
jgi:hypothetical protein